MKNTLRRYFSIVVLLCLAVQLAPFGLVHSHDVHQHAKGVQVSHNDNGHDCDHDKQHQENQNNDADFAFDILDDCDFCDVLHAINNQTFALSQETALAYTHILNETSTFVPNAFAEVYESSSQGRAPPAA